MYSASLNIMFVRNITSSNTFLHENNSLRVTVININLVCYITKHKVIPALSDSYLLNEKKKTSA